MDLIAKGRDFEVSKLKTSLKHWLRFGHLRPEQGIALLVGLIPDEVYVKAVLDWGKNKTNDENILDDGILLLSGNLIFSWPNIGHGEASNADAHHQLEHKNLSTNEQAIFIGQAKKRFGIIVREYGELIQYWESDSDIHPKQTPLDYFVDWALSKRLRPEWLDFAIVSHLYTPKQESIEDNTAHSKEATPPVFDKASSTYPQELDIALQAWRITSTAESKEKPKARIRAWLNDNANELSNEAKDRIATVVNWDKKGGATRTD